MQIDILCNNNNEIDVSEEVKKLARDYNPKSEVSTNIKTNIVLTDEYLVYERARRLAPLEKDILKKRKLI